MERDTTLSEVLITIGIIGVLLSLVMPTLIKDVKNKQMIKIQKQNIDYDFTR